MSSKWLERQKMLEAHEIADQPTDEVLIEDVVPALPPKPGKIYRVVKNDTIWKLAARFKTPAKELIEHNDLNGDDELVVGSTIRLPIARDIKEDKHVSFEIFKRPRTMHVNKPEGTRKYSFGNVKKWADIQTTGVTFPHGANILIGGIARVPVEDQEAAYYMDVLNIGDYFNTGRVAHTTGFSWSHLSEGVYTEPEPEELEPEPEEPTEPDVVPATAPEVEPELPPDSESITTAQYKATFKGFVEPVRYVAKDTLMVHEIDGRAESKTLYKDTAVTIEGVFTIDDEEHGRPKRNQHGHWFCIPMKYIKPFEEWQYELQKEDEELYNYQLDLSEKIALAREGKRTLSLTERSWDTFSRVVGKGTNVQAYVRKIKSNKKITKE